VRADPDQRSRDRRRLPFELDHFRVEALDALHAGHHVLIAAPTGSGKGVVAEYGIEVTRRAGQRVATPHR
jgi:ATP-dependent RNA helicase HelY